MKSYKAGWIYANYLKRKLREILEIVNNQNENSADEILFILNSIKL